MLEIDNITFYYPRRSKPTYCDFSLKLNEGGVYGLLGPNGAGKSTLLYLIAGLLNSAEGRVLFHGTDTRRRLPSTLSQIFLVPEEIALPPVKVGKYAKVYGQFYPRYSESDFLHNLEHFNVSADDNFSTMSMGQRKKAFIAFALACNTDMLLMDEPTNGLDIPGKSQFRRLIAETMTDNRIIIISTHQVRDIEHLLDHIIIINDGGQLLLDASTYEIASRLNFGVTVDASVAREALFCTPAIGGMAAITRRDPADESDLTDINLEMLFEYAIMPGNPLSVIFPASEAPAEA